MRIALSLILAGFIALSAFNVRAGTVTMANGQVMWQSTQCPAPQKPPALAALNPETAANDVNALSIQHNTYAAQVQAYMDCMSKEAELDANLTAKGIIASAQAQIQAAQVSVDASGALLRRP